MASTVADRCGACLLSRRGLLQWAGVLVVGGLSSPDAFGSDNGVKNLLDQMAHDARNYYVPEGLPGRPALLDSLAREPDPPWTELSPLQGFFLFETAPTLLKRAPPEFAQAAYVAAMKALTGDWWGPYGRPDSDSSRRLLQIDGIDACLLALLDDDQRLAMGDSEPATLAKLETFQVGDLAALLLAAEHQLEYPMHAPLPQRQARRAAIRARLAAH